MLEAEGSFEAPLVFLVKSEPLKRDFWDDCAKVYDMTCNDDEEAEEAFSQRRHAQAELTTQRGRR